MCFGVEKFRGRPPVAVVCLPWSGGCSAEAEADEIVQQPVSMNGDACIMMHVCIMQPWHHASCIRACKLAPRELGSGVDLHGGGDIVLPAHDPARVRLARLLDVEALRCGLERGPIG